jgi:hypothetical protein
MSELAATSALTGNDWEAGAMSTPKQPYRDPLERAVMEALGEATGRETRENPVLAGTGGPAGNALLTAWTGLVLLVVSSAELLTLFNVRGLISWHVALGALLIPPAGMKTASTGWRMVRYYAGATPYRRAGPPPMLLRVLGPVVVASTLGLLGTGVLLVLLGEERSRHTPLDLAAWRVDWVTAHQAFLRGLGRRRRTAPARTHRPGTAHHGAAPPVRASARALDPAPVAGRHGGRGGGPRRRPGPRRRQLEVVPSARVGPCLLQQVGGVCPS